MSARYDVSVIISTYNRCKLLPKALESVLTQEADGIGYEVLVVDNNSTDDTRSVVESYIQRGPAPLRYVFEGRQGVSYARNAGIALAQAPIIAFFDDDVYVSRDWIATLKRALDEHPEVDFVGGKVLPRWPVQPPRWLTRENWSPLALIDYGEEPFYVNLERQACLVSANLAVRRSLFDAIGLFAPDLQRVKDSIGSMEDHELLIRVWRAGRQGLYVPQLLVSTDVPLDRMTKAYHRRWHSGHGRFSAMLRIRETADPHGRFMDEVADAVRLYGVPGFLYREALTDGWRWLQAKMLRQQHLAFMYETNVRFLLSYIRARYEQEKVERHRSPLAEVGDFARNILRKKLGAALPGAPK
jgi:glycosyltransferase involved in cell wall biosynthesis